MDVVHWPLLRVYLFSTMVVLGAVCDISVSLQERSCVLAFSLLLINPELVRLG